MTTPRNGTGWKIAAGAVTVILALIGFIWQTSVPPAAGKAIEGLVAVDSLANIRMTAFENRMLIDSIQRDRQTALLIEVANLLKDRLPQPGPHR